jgi:predicted HAD superfamily Cof-like phosphohydrolase
MDKQLEISMLSEELTEFKDAKTEVDELDAIVDLIYVSIGTLHKTGLSPEQIDEAINVVCDANNAKLFTKTIHGKIMKNHDFEPPEDKLQEILDNR